MAEFKIVKTVELSTMPNPQLARDLLERLRAATAKVVTNRKWRVGVLKEFYPNQKGLLGLNVNRGQSIMIRLREGDDQFSFLPWHSVLGTLVHELTHNDIGEHSAEFYKAVDKLYDEVEASSTDAGSLWNARNPPAPKYDFEGKSSKVGGGELAKKAGVPSTNVRQLAAEAALRRASQASSGPQVLGGARPAPQKTPKELFLEGEQKRREQYQAGQGCSVVKSPAAAAKGAARGDVYDLLNVDSMAGGKAFADASSWQWTCHVCTEVNTSQDLVALPPAAQSSASSSSSRSAGQLGAAGAPAIAKETVCAWCGCAYGSTLEQPVTTAPIAIDAVVSGVAASSSSSSGASGSRGAEVICIDCAPENNETRDNTNSNGFGRKRRKTGAEAGGTAATASASAGAAINLTSQEDDEYCVETFLRQGDCLCCVPRNRSSSIRVTVKQEPAVIVNTAANSEPKGKNGSKSSVEIIDLID